MPSAKIEDTNANKRPIYKGLESNGEFSAGQNMLPFSVSFCAANEIFNSISGLRCSTERMNLEEENGRSDRI